MLQAKAATAGAPSPTASSPCLRLTQPPSSPHPIITTQGLLLDPLGSSQACLPHVLRSGKSAAATLQVRFVDGGWCCLSQSSYFYDSPLTLTRSPPFLPPHCTTTEEWFKNLPPITRAYLVAAFFSTIFSHFGIISPAKLIWELEGLKNFQVGREEGGGKEGGRV